MTTSITSARNVLIQYRTLLRMDLLHSTSSPKRPITSRLCRASQIMPSLHTLPTTHRKGFRWQRHPVHRERENPAVTQWPIKGRDRWSLLRMGWLRVVVVLPISQWNGPGSHRLPRRGDPRSASIH